MKVSETHNLLTCYSEVAKSIDFDETMKAWKQNPKKYAHITCLEDCSKITPASKKCAIFKCLKNPEHNNWNTTISNRTCSNNGCPQCSGRVASKGNNLLECYPEVAESIDFKATIEYWKQNPKKYIHVTCLEDCRKIMPVSGKRAIFKCLKNSEHDGWDTAISNRTCSNNGCPQCSGRVASKGNNLLECYPEVAESIDFKATLELWKRNPKKYAYITCLKDCEKITPINDKHAFFKCLKNSAHDGWDTTIGSRTSRSCGCPQCMGQKASKGNNLLECYPEVAESIDFKATSEYWKQNPKKYIHVTCLEDCSKITPSSSKRAIFKCLKNPRHNSWDSIISHRTSFHGCPQCAGKVASKGNNLLECYPEVAESIDFKATIEYWKQNPKKYIHVTCLEDCRKIMPASGKRAIFKCLKNSEHNNWEAAIYARTSQSCCCPQCSGKVASKGNNLLECYPEVAESIDFKATLKYWKQNPQKYIHVASLEDCKKISPSCNKKAIFKCLENPEHDNWGSMINNRTSKGNGCPKCANANSVSKEEKLFKKKLVKILQLKSNEYKTNARIISSFNKKSKQKLELDFVCEKLGIAVEFNGAYWHSDKVIRKTRGVSADFYHRYKFEQAKKLGLTLLFVREQDWMNNKETVLTAIRNYCFKHTKIPKILQLQA